MEQPRPIDGIPPTPAKAKPKTRESDWDFRPALPIIAAMTFILSDGCGKTTLPDAPKQVRQQEVLLKGNSAELRQGHVALKKLRISLIEQSLKAKAGNNPDHTEQINKAIILFNEGIIRNHFAEPARLEDGSKLDAIKLLPEIK